MNYLTEHQRDLIALELTRKELLNDVPLQILKDNIRGVLKTFEINRELVENADIERNRND